MFITPLRRSHWRGGQLISKQLPIDTSYARSRGLQGRMVFRKAHERIANEWLMQPRAYSYIRLSTDVQLKGDGLRRQMQLSADYAKKTGLDLDTTLRLKDEGVSAFRGDNATNGKLRTFLDAVSRGAVPKGSYLLIESLDRLSRQRVAQSLFLFLDLIRAGINIVTLADEKIYGADVDDMQLIMSIIVMTRAHEESEMKSLRLAKAWEAKRQSATAKKLTAKAPMWLELAKDRSAFVPLPERVDIVQKIFRWSAEGAGAFTVARRLNRLGVPPFKRGAAWGTSSVAKVLQNRAVLGEMQPHRLVDGRRVPVGDPIPDYFPAIVGEPLFRHAQGARVARRASTGGRRGMGQKNLFTHVAKCARCGSPMHLVNKGSRPKGTVALRCSAALKGAGCEAQGWNYAQFEKSFLTYVSEVGLSELASGEISAERASIEDAIRASEQRIGDLRLKRDKTFDLASSNDLGSDYYREKAAEIFGQIQSEENTRDRLLADHAKVQTASRPDNLEDLVRAIQLASTDNEEVRVRASATIKSVVKSLKLEPSERPRPLLLPSVSTNGARVAADVAHSYASFRISLTNGVERRVWVDKKNGTIFASEWSDDICSTRFAASAPLDDPRGLPAHAPNGTRRSGEPTGGRG